METLNKKRLGDILVSSGKITYEQLNEALEEALKNKRATYAQEEAERKTEMQRGYFR